MTSKHRQPGARAMATTSGTSRTTDFPGPEGSPWTGNRGHFWSSAWFTWTVLSVGLIACGIYLWVTKIEPVIPGLLEFITQPL
ncbi:hypothetical protein [Arthrobacter crystallopoietes]|uniref:hypothetical protein n=1 Tax=Crystallibacter crystallopoietes TaxID=37928 RepID=UPI001ABE8321|nr:hypothetical protein [Arthrobacter crystallopoietes]QTG82675.1 hypothetical protein J5251_09195 [Arthrobacter crystallopoietes]